ncbi:MAG: metallophosphoesterase [Prevotella sp.]|nr:metallophosphoesterase [Prevotella sp.]MDY4844418.1 metallophosphoesterase [Prevotella sp.]
MINRIILSTLCLLSFGLEALCFSPDGNEKKLSADGPYIVYDSLGTGATITTVTTKGAVKQKHVKALPSDYSFTVNTSDCKHAFKVQLHNIVRPAWNHQMPARMLVTSDPHANFDCFFNLLNSSGVIDNDCNWTFGNAHLVIIGDVMDRGDDATAIFWLLYKLEAQAAKAGGAVHFLMGNHEPLVLMNDNRYTNAKYTLLSDTLGVSYNHFFSQHSELGRWISSHNTIERIGRNIFVHAGLSPDLYDTGLTIEEVNALMPTGLYKRKAERKATGKLAYMLHGSYGPIWYRGLVLTEEKYRPIKSDSLDMILNHFDADRIIVGHTIFDDISSFHEGRVIGVNVDNKANREEGRGRALLIENGVFWIVDDKGKMKKLL